VPRPAAGWAPTLKLRALAESLPLGDARNGDSKDHGKLGAEIIIIVLSRSFQKRETIVCIGKKKTYSYGVVYGVERSLEEVEKTIMLCLLSCRRGWQQVSFRCA
jgi:hypothetical protein